MSEEIGTISPTEVRALLAATEKYYPEAVPALAYLVLVLRVPESPRWLLLRKNDEKRAREILAYSNPGNVDGVSGRGVSGRH